MEKYTDNQIDDLIAKLTAEKNRRARHALVEVPPPYFKDLDEVRTYFTKRDVTGKPSDVARRFGYVPGVMMLDNKQKRVWIRPLMDSSYC